MNKVELKIDNKLWVAWETVEFEWSIDSYSTVTFTAPFEPDNKEFRDTFRPFTYKSVELVVEGEQLFVGWMLGVNPKGTPDRTDVEVTAYALPAVLEDCTAPASLLPLEFKNMKLRAITETICKPFGVRVHFQSEEGAAFEKVAIEADKKIQEFIIELAKHRNLVLTNAPNGELVYWRSAEPGRPVVRLRDNEPPVTGVEATFSPQEYYSEITGFGKPKRRKKGTSWTEPNPFLPDVLRPLSFKLDEMERGEAPEATKAQLGRMFANMASYTVDLATWRDPQDLLWQPNTTVTLLAPKVMCYQETELLIRKVKFVQDKESESASLNLVLPGAFSGEVPGRLPWSE